MEELDKYPIDIVMRLYRQKLSAEERGDIATLKKLRQNHPDLFTDNFEKFINNLSWSLNDIYDRHGIDFRTILDPEDGILH